MKIYHVGSKLIDTLRDITRKMSGDVQFKVACRVLDREDDILDIEHSLERLLEAIDQEIRIAEEESL